MGCNRNYTGIQGRVFINSVSNNCILTIQAPLNRTISLYFSDFYVYSNNQCTDSSLVVRDGLTANSLSVARLCGYRLPNAIFSTGNSLRLEFTIGNNINPHMDATYTTTDQAFDIGSRSTCTTDFVEIYDVNSDTNEETFIARYCGGLLDKAQELLSKGRIKSSKDTPAMHEGTMTTISVRYTSSVHNGGTGWVARFLGKVQRSIIVTAIDTTRSQSFLINPISAQLYKLKVNYRHSVQFEIT
ncbi:hypothetical protein C0J52_00161 [Blattella germanica]|nr:hypothetical protein C0J52_00161 [Blattella germanica]